MTPVTLLILCLLVPCVIGLVATVYTWRRGGRWVLLWIPTICIAAAVGGLAYKSLLGKPVDIDDFPDKFTLIWFKVDEPKSITAWIILPGEKKGRLVIVPYNRETHKGMESLREALKSGNGVYLEKNPKRGRSGDSKSEQDGNGISGEQGTDSQNSAGWPYRTPTSGPPTGLPGGMPSKVRPQT